MTDDTGTPDVEIGARARKIRQRRGLSLDVVAGMAGISKGHLSRLETGHKSFTRRGLIENLADALGCSPLDLTGTAPVATDLRTVRAASAIPALTAALHDTTLDDVPDVPVRPLAQLVAIVDAANAAADEVRYELHDAQLGDVVTELHVAAATLSGDERRTALAALVTACVVARSLAATLGHAELAVTATRRGWDAARQVERPDLTGLMAMGRVISLNRIGARRRAGAVLDTALEEIAQQPGPVGDNTSTAEARGMLHLSAAQLAARRGDLDAADTYLDEAESLARYTGERNFMRYHFGPANVAAWRLAVAVETDRGPEGAERFTRTDVDLGVLGSADRVSSVHFDLARGFAQASGSRDGEALRHIDTADRIAPIRIRSDPLTRELVIDLDRRARRRVWELDSMRRRVGIA